MKKMFVLIGIFACVSIFASGHGPSGTIFSEAVTIHTGEGIDPEEGMLPETTPYPVQNQEDLTMRTEPSRYAPLWGPDLLVTDQCVIPYRYNIALDYDANGYIYAGIQSCHSSGTDTLFVYRTTDNGYTWNMIYSMNPGTGGQLLDFDMKLEPFVSDNPNIYLIWADSVPASGYRLFFGAVQPGYGERWLQFSDPDYDSVFQVAMDVEPDSNPFIVISLIRLYHTPGETSWLTASSADTGVTWDMYGPHTSSLGPKEVTAACNDSDVFYVGTIYNQSSNRFRMWGNQSGFVNVSSANDTVRSTPQLASQKYHTYPSNYVYGLYTQGTNPRVYYNYSSDGGNTWQTPGIWSMSGDVYSNNPNM
ncbi:hypothetical protein JXA84_09040, partial [candidate division WOR-3 bacterium]|nr:hypothetical protein [candidate division WOR-3 bacterium]